MNARQAGYILAIRDAGSISAAAKTLFISQPALSQTLRLAEKMLGAPIFKRGVTPLKLTYAGERYVAAAQQLLQIEENLKNEISEINKEEQGRLCFGVSRQRGAGLLPQILPQFSARYPQVELVLEEHGSATLEELTAAGTIDLALASAESRHPELTYRLVEHEALVLLADPASAFAQTTLPGATVQIEQALGERFVSLKHGHGVRTIQDKIFAKLGVQPDVLVETDSFETAMRITVACGGVMICPHVYLQNAAAELPRGVQFPIAPTGFERSSYLCYRKELYQPRYVRDWMALIEAQVRKTTQEDDR